MKKLVNIFEQQEKYQKKLDERLSQQGYTAKNPLVICNPYGIAPLSAMICFRTDEPASFQITLSDCEKGPFMRYTSALGKDHRLPIACLIAEGKTHVCALGSDGSIVNLDISAPIFESPLDFEASRQGKMGEIIFFLPADSQTQPIGINAFGQLCWTCSLPLNHQLLPLDNGHFLCGAPGQLAPPYSGTAIWEIDALGKVYREYRFEDGCSGDFVLLSNGLIVAITQNANHGTARDVLIWIDPKTGCMLNKVSAHEWIPPINGTAGQSGTDWFQGSQLVYDENTDTLYWSGLAQNIILILDATSGKLKRILGHSDGWQERLPAHYFGQPIDRGVFEEAYGFLLEEDTNVLQFINGHRYPKGKKDKVLPATLERIDINSGKIIEKHVFPACPCSPIFNDIKESKRGEAFYLLGGIGAGDSSVPAFFLKERMSNIVCESQLFVYDKSQLKLAYRVNTSCKSFYVWSPESIFINQKIEKIYGHWKKHFEVDVTLPVTEETKLEADFPISFWQDEGRLYLQATFFQGEMTVLLLENETEKHQFFVQANRKPFGSEWLQSYVKDPERIVHWAIPISHLYGEWKVSLLIDDVLFHTEEVVVIEKKNILSK